MDIVKLVHFLRICEENNISKAAQGLFITQQGLSKSIISLEHELKVPLFYRTPEGMLLTKYGEAIKDHAERIVAADAGMREAIARLKHPDKTKLTVHFALGVLNSLEEDLIDRFAFLHPDIELVLNEYPDNICHQALLDNEDALGIVIGPVDPNVFDAELLKRHLPHANISVAHPLSERSSLTLEDLDGENVITVNENFQMYHNFLNACKVKHIAPSIVHTTGEIFITYKMSSLDKGIGIAVDFVSDDIKFANVKSIPIQDDAFTWDVMIVRKKNAPLHWAAQEFIDHVKGCAPL